jgi:tetratricopeptide (TPR) repeat protein
MSRAVTRRREAGRVNLGSELVTLQAKIDALQKQRRSDLDRYRETLNDRELLRFELSETRSERRVISSPDSGHNKRVDGWQVRAAAVRSIERGEPSIKQNLLTRLLAGLLLRFARRAAHQMNYAKAEVLYQAILEFRPRSFLWRQIGNMQAAQGLFVSAIGCFDQAIQMAPLDAESHFARGIALKRSGNVDQGNASISRAIELDGSMAHRAQA